MICKSCGREISDLAVVCVNCGAKAAPNKITMPDKPSAMLNIISFLIPIIGIICWATMSSTTPKKAKACGVSSIISLVLSALFTFAYFVIIMMYQFNLFHEITQELLRIF